MTDLTRRNFLKLAGGTLCAAAALPFTNLADRYGFKPTPERNMFLGQSLSPLAAPPASLGRVATSSVNIYAEANRQSSFVRKAYRDEILSLVDQIAGEAVTSSNAIWYQTTDGFVHSAFVQPVENILNPVDLAQNNFWGEVTVPFSDSRRAPSSASGLFLRVYYTCVFRVIEVVTGTDDQPWYRLQDGITWSPGPYVPAAHIRRIDPTELTPLSPGASKRVEVNLQSQIITAYENDVPVLTSSVASGYGANRTPSGTHHVLFKSLASRMIGGQGSGYYDLPGVPFPTYFTGRAAAIHGAYWHNDFGHPRSHGCLNVPAPVARWFWRWTEPSAPFPYEARRYDTPRGIIGTEIKVA
ncbi:MAG TPA: L,D-transpeptidase family protein [Anaerolineae bacterium]|nr:L,D-transpeptidase family protein [Anaerolineae bacterium]